MRKQWKQCQTYSTSCEESTYCKIPWCWEGLRTGGEGDDRGWDGWMASSTRWTWVWVNSEVWWWTGKPGVLRCMGSQRVGHNWVTELNFDLTIPVLWKFTLKIGFQNMKIHVNKFINCSNICNDKILKTIWCPNQGYWLSKLWWNGKFYSLE